MPLLSTSNRYALLDVDLVEENLTLPSKPTDEATIVADIQSTPPTPSHQVYPPCCKLHSPTFPDGVHLIRSADSPWSLLMDSRYIPDTPVAVHMESLLSVYEVHVDSMRYI
jgi:hypothetical protein